MNHDHDRSRSFFSRSRQLLINELTFGVRAGSGVPRLRPRDFQLAGSRARSGAPRALSFEQSISKVSFPKSSFNSSAPNRAAFRRRAAPSSSTPQPHARDATSPTAHRTRNTDLSRHRSCRRRRRCRRRRQNRRRQPQPCSCSCLWRSQEVSSASRGLAVLWSLLRGPDTPPGTLEPPWRPGGASRPRPGRIGGV